MKQEVQLQGQYSDCNLSYFHLALGWLRGWAKGIISFESHDVYNSF